MAKREPAVVETVIAARKAYDRCVDHWKDNQQDARDDLEFGRLGRQWPEKIEEQRKLDNRPCLTFNKFPAFIRQVVNDARQNKPQIKVHPQDSNADPRTAEIINGLIRNIETTSDADVAYDTAIEQAVGQGFGFWRINTAYTCDDAFDQDIVIERIVNPFTVYGDPNSTAADSSDWNVAFIVVTMTRDEFEREYPNAEKVDWDADFRDAQEWLDGDNVLVAEYWTREKVRSEIIALSDGSVRKVDEVKKQQAELEAHGIEIVGEPREVESYKVTQRIMSGAEVLKTVEWAGKYIPIVPVYGDEVVDEDGRRWYRSLIRDAKSAQQMLNYWRTTTTELVALSPKAPFIMEEGALGISEDEARKWETANTETHAYLLHKNGTNPPQRQPFAGIPAGALQEALNANDDMKAIIGIYDASLGARSNETSGRAIMARQREGDVSTFHFIDNLSRSIRHGGRIILDLIPKVYTTARIARTLGEDMAPKNVQIAPTGQSVTEQPDESGAVQAIYDITVGKYDLVVKAGPSFTTMREENRLMMTEAAQAGGEQVASVLIPEIMKLMDFPNADEIAQKLEGKLNPQQQGLPPEVQQQMQQGMQIIQQQGAEIERLKQQNADKATENALKARDQEIEQEKNQIAFYEAETARIQAQQPQFVKVSPTAGQSGTA